MILNELGLEKEIWLLDEKGNILEPSLFGFPSDEMGFLIEIRSEHSPSVRDILLSLEIIEEINRSKADRLGLQTIVKHQMDITKEFQDYIYKKYRLDTFPDFTKNIYGARESHHTGFRGDKATAGLHVHFSRRNTSDRTSEIVQLPIEEIVRQMDNKFKDLIESSGRIPGEYEPKKHGFEYRSLPATAPIREICRFGLSILGKVS